MITLTDYASKICHDCTPSSDHTDLDSGGIGWTVKTAKRNFWRVSGWYELDDLIQDGFLCYQVIVTKYEWRPRSRQLLMSLYKRMYLGHIHDLAKMRTRQPVELLYSQLIDNIPDVPIESDALITTAINTAPPIVKAAINLILSGDSRIDAPYPIRSDGTRETFGERLSRITGWDGDVSEAIKQVIGA